MKSVSLFKKICLIVFTLAYSLCFPQVKIGQWVDHLSYNYASSVAKVGSTVYVSNGTGMAKYNTDDNSIEKLTTINGLSDVGVQLLRKNSNNDVILAIYENTNIDVIKPDGSIINVSDIKRKIVPGKKIINEVFFYGNLAYLACGFGIIIFDTDKLEIKDTYYIGNGSLNYNVYQVTKNDTAIFIATDKGVYYGGLKNNLNYYANWKPLNTGIANGPYNSIIQFNGKILANYSERLNSDQSFKDTIYEFNGSSWSKFPFKTHSENKKLYDYSKFNKIMVIDQWGFQALDADGLNYRYIVNYGFGSASINDGYTENMEQFWVADKTYGLIKSEGSIPYSNQAISINGPDNNFANDIDIKDGYLAVAPANLGETFRNTYNNASPNVYQEKEWKSLRMAIAPASTMTVQDINCVSIDPNDKNHVAYGCMSFGVLELKNNQLKQYYTSANSPLIGRQADVTDINLTGIGFDKNSNLWNLVTGSSRSVQILKKNGTWLPLDFSQFASYPTVSKIIFTKYDQAWIILARGGGLLAYNDVNNLNQPNSSNTKLVGVAKGSGLLPTNDVYSICEDLDGHIWVGTTKGITVFNNPQDVFTSNNWDSQQILIEQDGHVQILLENDGITAIAVDGANRKWIGTESSGVYCLSADGQIQINHFTKETSPLYSNSIRDIVVDETTGDVFVATALGIQAYRTAIIKGLEDFKNVHAYPNPIKPGFSGQVYVTGLIDESIVKITDVAGNLVWETKSEGGQIEWNLNNFSGKRVTSGVYLVFCASANGEKSATTKLLVIN